MVGQILARQVIERSIPVRHQCSAKSGSGNRLLASYVDPVLPTESLCS